MYLWWNGEGYEMVGKDMEGGVSGEFGAGIHLHSRDSIAWQMSQPIAYPDRQTGLLYFRGSAQNSKRCTAPSRNHRMR